MKLLQVRKLTFFAFQYKKVEKIETIPLTVTSVSHDSIFFPLPSSQADTKASRSLQPRCTCGFILLVSKSLCLHESWEMVPKLKIKGICQWKIPLNRQTQGGNKKKKKKVLIQTSLLHNQPQLSPLLSADMKHYWVRAATSRESCSLRKKKKKKKKLHCMKTKCSLFCT